MKKIVLSAAVALFAMNAQAATDEVAVNVNITLVEVIDIYPETQGAATGNFNTLLEYQFGQALDESPETIPVLGSGEFEFYVGASTGYQVDLTCPTNFNCESGDCTGLGSLPIPASDLSIQVVSPPAGSTNQAAAYT